MQAVTRNGMGNRLNGGTHTAPARVSASECNFYYG